VDGTPTGDVYVSIAGALPDNFIVRIRQGLPIVLAYSSAPVANPNDAGTKFVVSDPFGTLFTAFASGNSLSGNPLRLFSVSPGNLTQTGSFLSGVITGGAHGAGIDAAGILFIADAGAFIPQLVVVSTSPRRWIDSYPLPSVPGISQPAPRDAAVGPDGSVFVAVDDLLQTAGDPGAILRYTRN
jgi:hypothetical protein